MIRLYGEAPFSVAVIHGGPGALGSMAGVARELSKSMGVAEPLQSRFDIAGLLDELHDQLDRVCEKPVTLIGHAWGAWLALLYAAKWQDDVRRLVLVGTAPLDVRYSGQILACRRERMTQGEWALFNGLLFRLEREPPKNRSWLMEQIEALLDRTDNYELVRNDDGSLGQMPINGGMYLAVWAEAESLCESGELIERIRNVRCPVYVIHGDYDPRPVEGVTVPLHANNIAFKRYVLKACGHAPFREKRAAGFYGVLDRIIRGED